MRPSTIWSPPLARWHWKNMWAPMTTRKSRSLPAISESMSVAKPRGYWPRVWPSGSRSVVEKPQPSRERKFAEYYVCLRCLAMEGKAGTYRPGWLPPPLQPLRGRCLYGWGGRNRTYDAGVNVRCLHRLATPQKNPQITLDRVPPAGVNGSFP